jgi:acetyltransferase-like isoleucine patch superfamily enzyme
MRHNSLVNPVSELQSDATNLTARSIIAGIRSKLWPILVRIRRFYLNKFWGMDIGRDCLISFSAILGGRNPRGIHIGDGTMVDLGASVLTYDDAGQARLDTWIGKDCHISARSVIFPGVNIGDHSIVRPASIVMNDVPPNCVVSGHPARIIQKGVQTGRWGIMKSVVDHDFEGVSVESEDEIVGEFGR